MDLPDFPFIDLPLAKTFRCPSCNQKIASWVLSEHFTCPSCAAVLASNKKAAFNKGILVGVTTYAMLAGALSWLHKNNPIAGALIYCLGGIAAFYAGHLFYRSAVVVSKWQR